MSSILFSHRWAEVPLSNAVNPSSAHAALLFARQEMIRASRLWKSTFPLQNFLRTNESYKNLSDRWRCNCHQTCFKGWEMLLIQISSSALVCSSDKRTKAAWTLLRLGAHSTALCFKSESHVFWVEHESANLLLPRLHRLTIFKQKSLDRSPLFSFSNFSCNISNAFPIYQCNSIIKPNVALKQK